MKFEMLLCQVKLVEVLKITELNETNAYTQIKVFVNIFKTM